MTELTMFQGPGIEPMAFTDPNQVAALLAWEHLRGGELPIVVSVS